MTIRELVRPLPGVRRISLLRQQLGSGTQRTSGNEITRAVRPAAQGLTAQPPRQKQAS